MFLLTQVPSSHLVFSLHQRLLILAAAHTQVQGEAHPSMRRQGQHHLLRILWTLLDCVRFRQKDPFSLISSTDPDLLGDQFNAPLLLKLKTSKKKSPMTSEV